MAQLVQPFPMAGRHVPLPERRTALHLLALAGAVATFLVAVRGTDLRGMNDLGLISVLPWPVFVALALLSVSFCLAIRRESPNQAVLFLHVVVLILMLFGVTAIVESIPRFESTWKHAGITDYVMRNGSVDPDINAYFNWPGFFVVLAFLTDVTGVRSPLSFAQWTPFVLELLYLAPLLMIFDWATPNRRLTWLAVWVFYLANWIGQDYLSPQGFVYFLYLAFFAILLRWFHLPGRRRHPVLAAAGRLHLPTHFVERVYGWFGSDETVDAGSSRAQRIGLALLLLGIYAALVPTHQLTPFALLGGVMALVALDRCRLWWLPVVMAVMAALWLIFGAEAYFAGHGAQVVGQVGDFRSSLGASVTDRIAGSSQHVFVTTLRTVSTVLLWALALLGGIRRVLTGHRDVALAALAAVPFPLVLVQSYGGEILLRAYLFALPFMAFFVAALVLGSGRGLGSWLGSAILLAVSVGAIGLFLFTRYGNERMDYFTPQEAAAGDALYGLAPPGSLILAGTVKAPWKDRNYERYTYRALPEDIDWTGYETPQQALGRIEAMMADPAYPSAYFFITRSQRANDEMFGLLPVRLSVIEAAVQASPRFVLVFANDDAAIYQYQRVAPPAS